MAKRKRTRSTGYVSTHVNPSADWTREPFAKVNGRLLEPGTEVSVHGEGGIRFLFIGAVTTPSGASWLDFYETEKGAPGRYRSFKAERIRTVHRKNKTRANLAEAA